MDKIPRLHRAARRRLISRGRKTRDPQTALRFLMIAKLAQGLSRQQVARDLDCWPSTVVRAANRFARGGEEGLLDQRVFNGAPKVDARFRVELKRVLLSVPTEFGWLRTNWTRELLSLELADRGLPQVAACTMGRALSAIGARLGMPKPTVLCPWDSARRKRVLSQPGFKFQLDPTFEPELIGRPPGAPPPVPENTRVFAILQKYYRVGLLVPVGAPHMWNACRHRSPRAPFPPVSPSTMFPPIQGLPPGHFFPDHGPGQAEGRRIAAQA